MVAGSRVRAGTARVVVVCLSLAGASKARAQSVVEGAAEPAPRPARDAVEGAVVEVERDDLLVDLGALRGAADGDEVEIWRPLRVKHPVTGKVLADRFLIGKLRLVQVRPNLSLARVQGELARPALPGDVVVLAKAPPAPPAPPPSSAAPRAPAAPPAAGDDDETRALSRLFDELRGADPDARVRAYEAFAQRHPRGRYVQVLWEEARVLRRLRAPGDPVGAQEPPAGPAASVQPFGTVVAGEPLRVAVAVQGASGAVLHARTAGEESYASEPMKAAGSEYFAATIPAPRVRSPGLEWFVEAVGPEGTRPVLGDPSNPERSAVQDVQPRAPRRVLGQAAIWTDYASFDVRRTNDYVFQTEGVMGARLDDVGLRAVRTGFGVFRGVGGTLQQLDVQLQPGTPVGLTYGYLEGEAGIVPTFSIALRGIIGLQQDGVSGGASAFFRVGSDLETNLLVGGEVLGGIGLRGVAEFAWNSFRDWPIVLRSEVTNQPAGLQGDVGVRAIGQVGYRVLPHLVASLRASYQGRTIDHAGPGGGAAVAYAW
jgi:hypothetical protein